MSDPTSVVDARGQRCPQPVIALARRARDLPAGSLVVVLATDPAARVDIPAWARLRGHEMVGIEPEGPELWRLAVRLGPDGGQGTTRYPGPAGGQSGAG